MLNEFLIVPTVITPVHGYVVMCERNERQNRERCAKALDDERPNFEEMRSDQLVETKRNEKRETTQSTVRRKLLHCFDSLAINVTI